MTLIDSTEGRQKQFCWPKYQEIVFSFHSVFCDEQKTFLKNNTYHVKFVECKEPQKVNKSMAKFQFFWVPFYVLHTRKVAISLEFSDKCIQINWGIFFLDKKVKNGPFF